MENKLERIQDNLSYIVWFNDGTSVERKANVSIEDLCYKKTNHATNLIITYKDSILSEIRFKNVFKLIFHFTAIGNTLNGVTDRLLDFGYVDNNGDQHITTINLNTLMEI